MRYEPRQMRILSCGVPGLLFVVLFAASASAQCRADVDCKGDRICNKGTCADPPPREVAPPPPPSSSQVGIVEPPERPVNNSGRFARAAAFVGFAWSFVDLVAVAGSGVAIGFGIDKDHDRVTAESFDNLAWSVASLGVSGLLYGAGASVRNATGVGGLSVMRWVGVGLMGASLITTLVPLGLMSDDHNETVIIGMMVGTALLQVAGVLVLALDDLITGGDANDQPLKHASAFSCSPTVAFARTSGGGSAPLLGLTGTW